MAEQYCLKWNNHQRTLVSVFTDLLDSENLSDCILSAEGESLRAHQVVISACSPYLDKLLNSNRSTNQCSVPILIFNDLKFEELRAMREYMYKGEVNITQENLNSFLKAAQALQIKGLADQEDDGGGGSSNKRRADPTSGDYIKRSRRRRNSRDENCDSESSGCDTSNVVTNNRSMTNQQHQQRSRLSAATSNLKQSAGSVKDEVFSESNSGSVKAEPPDPLGTGIVMPHPLMKTEPKPEQPIEDLTLDDDDYNDYESAQTPLAGTSNPDNSQDMSNWQMDGSMNSEDYANEQMLNQSQSANAQVEEISCESDCSHSSCCCSSSSDSDSDGCDEDDTNDSSCEQISETGPMELDENQGRHTDNEKSGDETEPDLSNFPTILFDITESLNKAQESLMNEVGNSSTSSKPCLGITSRADQSLIRVYHQKVLELQDNHRRKKSFTQHDQVLMHDHLYYMKTPASDDTLSNQFYKPGYIKVRAALKALKSVHANTESEDNVPDFP